MGVDRHRGGGELAAFAGGVLTVLQDAALAEFELPFVTLRMTPTMMTGTATMATPRTGPHRLAALLDLVLDLAPRSRLRR